jgi:hypothetical protein
MDRPNVFFQVAAASCFSLWAMLMVAPTIPPGPHRGIHLTTPLPATSTPDVSQPVERVDRLIHQYQRAA